MLSRRKSVTMAIGAAHRSSIYQKLVPILGEEDANVMMSEFPAVEAEELVTKDFLRAELAVLRGDMGLLGSDLRTEMGLLGAGTGKLEVGLRGEMGTSESGLRAEMAAIETRLTIRLGGAIAASTAFLAALGIFT
ncbi:MAG: hypothetical protein ABIP36_03700 [Acidimicrobiales bacterium]